MIIYTSPSRYIQFYISQFADIGPTYNHNSAPIFKSEL